MATRSSSTLEMAVQRLYAHPNVRQDRTASRLPAGRWSIASKETDNQGQLQPHQPVA